MVDFRKLPAALLAADSMISTRFLAEAPNVFFFFKPLMAGKAILWI